jgi:dCTP deaminase
MVVLSDADILKAMESGDIAISPFHEENLTPNGYDLTIAEVATQGSGAATKAVATVQPAAAFLVSTEERVELGESVAASLWLRTTWARRGVLASFGKVDAGFRGTLTLAAFNASGGPLEVPAGETFAQVVFERLGSNAEKGYGRRSGHYQDQAGITPGRP